MKAILILLCLQSFPWLCSKDLAASISPMKIEDKISTIEIKSASLVPAPTATDKNVIYISIEIQNLSDLPIVFERWNLEFIQSEEKFKLQPFPLPFISPVLSKIVIEPNKKAEFDFIISETNLISPILMKSNSAIRLMQPNENPNATEFNNSN